MDATASAAAGDPETLSSVWTLLYVGSDRVNDPEQVKGPFKTVFEFREAVKGAWQNTLQHAGVLELRVYVNADDAKNGSKKLKASANLIDYLTSEEKPLIVVARAPAPASASSGARHFDMLLWCPMFP